MAGGILRIIFDSEDLARVRIASRADPLWEMVTSLHRLQLGDGGAVLTGWRRAARANLAEAGLMPQVRRLLIPLAPRAAYFPDFLTPGEAQNGVEPGIEALVDTPRRRLRRELELLRVSTGLPSHLEDLARGNRQAMRGLGQVATGYYEAALSEHWSHIERTVSQERGLLLRHYAEGGAERVLSQLPAGMRWRAPVLEIDYPFASEIELRGRGLTLIPSYFCRRAPVTLADSSLPPVIVYPMPRRSLPAPAVNDALAELLGRTRAEILRGAALSPASTTTELARHAGVSASSASEHARVLRQAGLIVSTRQANLMLHQATENGARLLEGL